MTLPTGTQIKANPLLSGCSRGILDAANKTLWVSPEQLAEIETGNQSQVEAMVLPPPLPLSFFPPHEPKSSRGNLTSPF